MRRLAWLVLLIPWGVPSFVAVMHRIPTGPAIVDLRGTWEWSATPPASSGAEWRALQLPGKFRRQGVDHDEFWLRRRFEWQPVGQSEMHLLTLGDLKQTHARVYVNGSPVGDVAAFDERQKAEWQSLEAVQVPTERLHPGQNELVLRVVFDARKAQNGISDSRLLLGPSSQLGGWFIRISRIEAFFRNAPLLVLLLMTVLLGALWRLESARRERRLVALAFSLTISSIAFTLAQTGLGGSLPDLLRNVVIGPAAFASAWLMCEFVSAYFFERAPWYVRALRVLAPVAALATLVELFSQGTLHLVMSVTLPVLLVSSVALMAQAGLQLRVKRDLSSCFLWSTSVAYATCALVDVLTDLRVWSLPRTFAIAQLNVAVISGIIVIARFIGLAERNKSLSLSLSASNKELAQALVDAQAATRLKSEFLANVSHELRTPLNSIINIPEGLLEDFVKAPDGSLTWTGEVTHTHRYLNTLHTAGKHLLGVVNQVLDFSKLEAGRMVLHPEQVSIQTLSDEMVQTLEGFARKRGIAITVAGEREGTFEVDRVAASQVLLNLGNNAIKFSPDKGSVELLVAQTPDWVEFRVVDHGIGISKENQSLIFESFRQVEGGATRRFGGTGLGLPISRQILQLHGGELRVESEPGQGSTFVARFPRVARLASTVEEPKKPLRQVVIVDDDPITIETFRLTLRSLDTIEVLAIEDSTSALEFIEASRPDLIVLDIMMPHVSGLMLLRQLRAREAFRDTPILVASAYPSNREVVEPLGATWVSKPWDDKGLQDLVRDRLGLREPEASTGQGEVGAAAASG